MHGDQVHRVVAGETLNSIAMQYGITTDSLLGYNQYITNPNLIYPGQVIIIPNRFRQSYVVRPGDTLSTISAHFGVPMPIISGINNITDSNAIEVGQILLIPVMYTVKQGDTLNNIAERLGISLRDLQIENNLSNSSVIHVGQPLILPFRSIDIEELQNIDNSLQPISKQFPGSFFYKGNPGELKVALTFDDGPSQIGTNEVLDILNSHGAAATFFLLGTNIPGNSDVVQRIVSEGHTVANHSTTHTDMRTLTQNELRNELLVTEEEVYNITGLRMALMRPPYGFINNEVIENIIGLGYKIIMWSVDSKDWRDLSPDQVLINIIPNIRDGSIILMHDTLSQSATKIVLPELIHTLKSQGYTFATVDNMLGINAYKPSVN
ncbi:MAG TPA: LysM peptidoglycan-binding domain-containing protein [Anaerovoracaceae bacterium]|nr:LysM peptidoglycan-binding domain-containing protein [Anaerovoracaceae bacterium]